MAKKKKVQTKVPETTWDLIKMIFKSFKKNLMKRLTFTIIVVVGVWILHTFLLVGPNGGFAEGPSLILNQILTLKGKILSGLLMSILVPSVISTYLMRGREIGRKDFNKQIGKKIKEIFSFRKKLLSDNVKSSVLFGILFALIFQIIINNPLASLLLALSIVFALINTNKSFMFILMRVLKNDARRLFKNVKPYTGKGTAENIFGFAFGSIFVFALFLMLWVISFIFKISPSIFGVYTFMSKLLLTYIPILGGAFIIYKLLNLKKQTINPMFLIALTGVGYFSIFVIKVLADDGGWQEAGGTFSAWAQSEGAILAVAQGTMPSIAVGATTIISTYINEVISVMNDSINVDLDVSDFSDTDDYVDTDFDDSDYVEDEYIDDEEYIEDEDEYIEDDEEYIEDDEEYIEDDDELTEEEKKQAEEQKKKDEAARKAREEKRKKEEAEKKKAEEALKKAEERLKKLEEAKKAAEEKKKRMEELRAKQKELEKSMKEANTTSKWWDWATTAVEVTKFVADKSVDVLANVTGPAGKGLKDIYTVATGTAEGLGKGIAEGKNYMSNMANGTVKGVKNLVVGKISDKAFGALGNKLGNKVPGLKDYNVGNVDWSKSRVGFVKDALMKNENVHSTVSDMVKDRFVTATKNAAQSHLQTEIRKYGTKKILGSGGKSNG